MQKQKKKHCPQNESGPATDLLEKRDTCIFNEELLHMQIWLRLGDVAGGTLGGHLGDIFDGQQVQRVPSLEKQQPSPFWWRESSSSHPGTGP